MGIASQPNDRSVSPALHRAKFGRINTKAKNAFLKTLVVILSACGTFLATATSHAPEEPLAKRVQLAEKIFVGTLINRQVLVDDWCHADLKVTRVIAGVTVEELIPVQWRPNAASYNAEENQIGLAILRYKDGVRYWLRPDTFVDPKFTDEALKFVVVGAILSPSKPCVMSVGPDGKIHCK